MLLAELANCTRVVERRGICSQVGGTKKLSPFRKGSLSSAAPRRIAGLKKEDNKYCLPSLEKVTCFLLWQARIRIRAYGLWGFQPQAGIPTTRVLLAELANCTRVVLSHKFLFHHLIISSLYRERSELTNQLTHNHILRLRNFWKDINIHLTLLETLVLIKYLQHIIFVL